MIFLGLYTILLSANFFHLSEDEQFLWFLRLAKYWAYLGIVFAAIRIVEIFLSRGGSGPLKPLWPSKIVLYYNLIWIGGLIVCLFALPDNFTLISNPLFWHLVGFVLLLFCIYFEREVKY
jgi:hypothetical protein